MKNLFRLILPLFLFYSCYHDSAMEESFDMDKVITADKMTALLTDIQLLEGIVGVEQHDNEDVKSISNEYFVIILEKHQTSREDFYESIRYYTYHIELMDNIYEDMITNLNKKESEIMLE